MRNPRPRHLRTPTPPRAHDVRAKICCSHSSASRMPPGQQQESQQMLPLPTTSRLTFSSASIARLEYSSGPNSRKRFRPRTFARSVWGSHGATTPHANQACRPRNRGRIARTSARDRAAARVNAFHNRLGRAWGTKTSKRNCLAVNSDGQLGGPHHGGHSLAHLQIRCSRLRAPPGLGDFGPMGVPTDSPTLLLPTPTRTAPTPASWMETSGTTRGRPYVDPEILSGRPELRQPSRADHIANCFVFAPHDARFSSPACGCCRGCETMQMPVTSRASN